METITYDQARDKINDGDIIFIRNARTFTSKVIRFFTRSKYSHVGIAFWAIIGGEERLMVVEAQGGTARRIINMSFYAKDQMDIVASPRPWIEYAKEALEHVGIEEYGWFEATYVGLRESLFTYLNILLAPRDFPGEICSEYVAKMLQLPTPHVSPQGLMNELNVQGYFVTLQIRKPS